ncbi:MAG: twin-arginine translocase TatA/TatE family subunit [Thaumarchaeota archaeon]|nr:twin-arginine translocase TatA/TatE family subunit [Nitrososphaerota archaeon]
MVLQIAGREWIILIVIVVILIFGAKKLPELARSMGKSAGEFRKGQEEAKREIEALKKEHVSPEREKLEEAAKALGIDVEGKTDEQIREEMQKALGGKPK